MAEIHDLGRINIALLEKFFGKLQTDEIVLTSERMDHIKEKHPDAWSLFNQHGKEIVESPDFIVKDGKHDGTVFMVKSLKSSNMNIIIRVALETDPEGLKNSVMTAYLIREKNLNKLIAKNKVLYKKE